MNKEELYFALPTENTTGPVDVLFTIPNQMTGNLFVSIWLVGVYGVFTIGATRYQQSIEEASLFGSFATFFAAFILVLLSSYTEVPIAGGNQLLPAALLLAANLLWNYMTGGR